MRIIGEFQPRNLRSGNMEFVDRVLLFCVRHGKSIMAFMTIGIQPVRNEIRLILFDGFLPRLARRKLAAQEIAEVIERDEGVKSIIETVPPLRRQRFLFFLAIIRLVAWEECHVEYGVA